MIVLAPGRLSTTIVALMRLRSFSPILRATVSVAPPGGYGTIRRIGLDGNAAADSGFWASTGDAEAAARASAPASSASDMRIMKSFRHDHGWLGDVDLSVHCDRPRVSLI